MSSSFTSIKHFQHKFDGVCFSGTHLEGVEEEEDPCKDSSVGVDSQQTNHPGETKERKDDHKSLQECAVCERERSEQYKPGVYECHKSSKCACTTPHVCKNYACISHTY